MASLPLARILSFPHPSCTSDAHTSGIYSISFSKDILFSCSSDRTVRIWDVKTQRLFLHPLIGHHMSVLCLDPHNTQDLLASADADGIVILWDISTGQLVWKWKAHDEAVLCLAFSGESLLTGSRDETVKLWNMNVFVAERNSHDDFGNGPTLLRTLHLGTPVLSIVFIEEKMRVFFGCGNGSISQWDLASGQLSLEFPQIGERGGISSLTLISGGKCLLSGGSDGNIRVFDVLSGVELECFHAHTNVVRSLRSHSSDVGDGKGRVIVSGSYDGTCSIWERTIDSGKLSLARTFSYEGILQQIIQDKAHTSINDTEESARIFSVVLKDNMIFCSGQGRYILAWPVDGLPD